MARYKNKKFLEELGLHFQDLRIDRGYSLNRLAINSGIPKSTLHRLETASGDVQVSLLYRIAQMLDITPKDLLNFSMPKEE